MRASSNLVWVAVGAILLGSLGACTYASNGQGGSAAALQEGDGAALEDAGADADAVNAGDLRGLRGLVSP